jgi:SNF2 family DNA or RNA helicase
VAQLNVTLKADQVEAVRYAEAHHYSINGYNMGKGKSIIALALALKLEVPTLIVCPAYLRINWENEALERVDGSLSVAVASSMKQVKSLNTKGLDLIIISYSLLKHARGLFKWAELVVADEVHLLKNPKAGRTDLFDLYLYEEMPPRFLGLTGTPLKNGTDEWYQLLKLCNYNPKETSGATLQFESQFEFAQHFCNSSRMQVNGRNVTKFHGIRNRSELRSLLKGKYLPSPPVELDGGELPPFVRKNVMLSQTPNLALLSEFEEKTVIGKGTKHKTSAAANMVLLAVPYIKGLIEEGSGPIVIFSDHLAPVYEYKELLGAEVITGATSMNRRGAIIKAFQAGKIPVLVGTIGALGTGVTLTAACHVVINDPPWVSGDLLQAEHRIWRIGQTKECISHRLMGSPQARYIYKMLADKAKTIRRAA